MADVKWIRVQGVTEPAQQVIRADQVVSVVVNSATDIELFTRAGSFQWRTDGTANSFGKLMKTLGIDGLG